MRVGVRKENGDGCHRDNSKASQTFANGHKHLLMDTTQHHMNVGGGGGKPWGVEDRAHYHASSSISC